MRFAAVLVLLPLLARAQLVTPATVPNGVIPVVFVNGYQFGCAASGDSGFAANFGSADKVLQASNLVSLYFDNCTVPGGSIESLSAAFGTFLSSIRYVNGAPVPRVDIVAHSMGGLIVRSYLSGKRDNSAGGSATFSPPPAAAIRRAVFLGTPNFGTAVASILGSDLQTKQMSLGSQFLFDLNTWNQGIDDLRGIDALAIAGNGGTGVESGTSGSPSSGFDDGVVQLTSASIGFAIPGRTRVIPYCHTANTLIFSFGACSQTTPTLNQINDASSLSGQIITSFLNGTAVWTTIGTAIESDKVGSAWAGILAAAQDANGSQFTLSTGTIGSSTLGLNNVAYKEAVPANTPLPLSLTPVGTSALTTNTPLPAGTSVALVLKPGPSIFGIVPAGFAQFPRDVAPGAFVTIYGANLAAAKNQSPQPYPTQLGDVQVLVNGGAAPLQYVDPGQINFVFPNLPAGIAQVTVKNATGQKAVNVTIAPAVPSIFTSNTVTTGPAAAENAVTFAVVGPNAPLHAGDYVALYLTGIGNTPETTTVTVGGQPCAGQFFFAGHVPSYSGLDQVNCQIPGGLSGAALPVIITTNGRPSNAATLAIQ